jgi:hypothetical protein
MDVEQPDVLTSPMNITAIAIIEPTNDLNLIVTPLLQWYVGKLAF